MFSLVEWFMLPREKFVKKGRGSVEDRELVAVLLGTGTKGTGVLQLAGQVVKVLKKGVEEGKEVKVVDLVQLDGVGEAKAARVFAGIELGRRLYCMEGDLVIAQSEDVYRVVHDIVGRTQEYLVALMLNARYELLGKRVVAIGTLNRVSVVPRDILIPALELNAAVVILAHNHPSGSIQPSKDDVLVTKKIKEALDLVGIKLLDHLVVGKNAWMSIEV